jgi:hypothetical protein
MTEDFDLEKLRLPPGEKWVVVPAKIQKRRRHFVKVPWAWVEKLTTARYIATYRVALYVLYRHWRADGLSFTLSNTAIAEVGVSRWRKWEALRELEGIVPAAVELGKEALPTLSR